MSTLPQCRSLCSKSHASSATASVSAICSHIGEPVRAQMQQGEPADLTALHQLAHAASQLQALSWLICSRRRDDGSMCA